MSAKLFNQTFTYDLKHVGHSWTKTITDNQGDWLKLKFESLGIPWVNTIAVYENDTYLEEFGHYNTKEKMVVVQLELEGSSSSPVRWEKGANVIVIPKSAFTNTNLNAAIQQAVDEQGNVNWSIMPDCLKEEAEITGLDRSNAEDETSEWIELMISKRKCSISEANAILDLLLIGVNKETTGEESIINLPKIYYINALEYGELIDLSYSELIGKYQRFSSSSYPTFKREINRKLILSELLNAKILKKHSHKKILTGVEDLFEKMIPFRDEMLKNEKIIIEG